MGRGLLGKKASEERIRGTYPVADRLPHVICRISHCAVGANIRGGQEDSSRVVVRMICTCYRDGRALVSGPVKEEPLI